MSGLCKDCKWWERLQYGFPWGECKRAESGKNGWSLLDTQVRPAMLAQSELDSTGESVGAHLYSYPDFGCNQFEENTERVPEYDKRNQ